MHFLEIYLCPAFFVSSLPRRKSCIFSVLQLCKRISWNFPLYFFGSIFYHLEAVSCLKIGLIQCFNGYLCLKHRFFLIFVLYSLIQYYWKSAIQESFEEQNFQILMDFMYNTFVQLGDDHCRFKSAIRSWVSLWILLYNSNDTDTECDWGCCCLELSGVQKLCWDIPMETREGML